MIEPETGMLLLRAIGVAEAADEPLSERDLEELAAEIEGSTFGVQQAVLSLEQAGLALTGLEDGESPMLLHPGRQYLDRKGDVSGAILSFLSDEVSDLNTREALLAAGSFVVDDFAEAVERGSAVAHTQEIIPPAFVSVVDEAMAIRLFAAASALMARLSCGQAAGCLAEEIIAVGLISEAKIWIEDMMDLEPLERENAVSQLTGVFELFQDDDVLNLFAMQEPADAAVAGHNRINLQLGIADQRPEAWFRPFGGVSPTGHLNSDNAEE